MVHFFWMGYFKWLLGYLTRQFKLSRSKKQSFRKRMRGMGLLSRFSNLESQSTLMIQALPWQFWLRSNRDIVL